MSKFAIDFSKEKYKYDCDMKVANIFVLYFNRVLHTNICSDVNLPAIGRNAAQYFPYLSNPLYCKVYVTLAFFLVI